MFVGSGVLLVDIMWFHIGCYDLKVFLVTLQHMSCSYHRVWHVFLMVVNQLQFIRQRNKMYKVKTRENSLKLSF